MKEICPIEFEFSDEQADSIDVIGMERIFGSLIVRQAAFLFQILAGEISTCSDSISSLELDCGKINEIDWITINSNDNLQTSIPSLRWILKWEECKWKWLKYSFSGSNKLVNFQTCECPHEWNSISFLREESNVILFWKKRYLGYAGTRGFEKLQVWVQVYFFRETRNSKTWMSNSAKLIDRCIL